MDPQTDRPVEKQYRTTAGYQMDDRRLILRGGELDGRSWVGVIAVGKRVFCGQGSWSPAGIYLVTDQLEVGADGVEANVAVPAFAAG
jgi:hypothetical protein